MTVDEIIRRYDLVVFFAELDELRSLDLTDVSYDLISDNAVVDIRIELQNVADSDPRTRICNHHTDVAACLRMQCGGLEGQVTYDQ